jgi:hypothetical protein
MSPSSDSHSSKPWRLSRLYHCSVLGLNVTAERTPPAHNARAHNRSRLAEWPGSSGGAAGAVPVYSACSSILLSRPATWLLVVTQGRPTLNCLAAPPPCRDNNSVLAPRVRPCFDFWPLSLPCFSRSWPCGPTPPPLGLSANSRQQKHADGNDPEPCPPPVSAELGAGNCIGGHCPCLAHKARPRWPQRSAVKGPRDLHLIRLGIDSKQTRRNRLEHDVGLPRLTGCSSHDQPPRLIDEQTPAEAKQFLEHSLRLARTVRRGTHEPLAEPKNAAHQRQRLDVHAARDLEHERRWCLNPGRKAFGHVRIGNEQVEGRRASRLNQGRHSLVLGRVADCF